MITNLKFHHESKEFVLTTLKNLNYVFYASKKYLKKHPVNNIKDLENQVLIMPKSPAAKRKILDDYCKKIDLELVPTYEITSSSVMKGMVLGDIGIGFANEQKTKDILNKLDIIEKNDADETKEGIATLNKSMMNRATVELVKMIKEHYKENKE